MRLLRRRKILFFALLLLPAKQIFAQSTFQAAENPKFISANISLHEFARLLFPWEKKHPDLATPVVTRGAFQNDKRISLNYRLYFPTLDIYSSAGVPLYFNDSSEASVKVIDALPQVIPEPDLNPRYQVRPTLREALAMIPGIPRSEWVTPAQIDYTVFVVIRNHSGNNPSLSKDIRASQAKPIREQEKAVDSNATAEGKEVPNSQTDAIQRNALAKQAEDEAIQRLKTRLNGSRIRVMEVYLMEP
ncbi:hypothetical protein [Silvibacterium dinghuense]|uniref:Uncharacterized protein n=1 Tax=Silvibacterium dinghuense TaxID=1560006 RepID=A0A4V1NVW7_9BACT|nr:hypothetical protein [Silvibacterium dinghuense]RXS97362.1 hypothetical protein ESZ00_05505 [Silvibacterium dinghuense]GGG98380.1 hypothetical protein GCM10011586_12210 [Silvibacterium dinghuense]